MKHALDQPLAAIFTMCEDYYLANAAASPRPKRGAVYRYVKKALTETLQAMAQLHAQLYTGYSVDKEHAGYLFRREPPMLFRVPYHVLPAFPTGDELTALWQLSRLIRSGNNSIISLSGSNVTRKIFGVVGDVDFCEYFPVNGNMGFDRLVSNMDGYDNVACVKVALADKSWRYPWGEDKPTAAR
jgi:hypothetical protein